MGGDGGDIITLYKHCRERGWRIPHPNLRIVHLASTLLTLCELSVELSVSCGACIKIHSPHTHMSTSPMHRHKRRRLVGRKPSCSHRKS